MSTRIHGTTVPFTISNPSPTTHPITWDAPIATPPDSFGKEYWNSTSGLGGTKCDGSVTVTALSGFIPTSDKIITITLRMSDHGASGVQQACNITFTYPAGAASFTYTFTGALIFNNFGNAPEQDILCGPYTLDFKTVGLTSGSMSVSTIAATITDTYIDYVRTYSSGPCSSVASPVCPGTLTWLVSGDIKHTGPTFPHKNATLSVFYKTCSTTLTGLTSCNNPTYPSDPYGDHTYYSDGTVAVEQITTDCSGNWTWTKTGSITAVCVAFGPWIVNPNFNSMDCTGADAYGNSNNLYFIMDPSKLEYACYQTGNGGSVNDLDHRYSYAVPGKSSPTGLWSDTYDATFNPGTTFTGLHLTVGATNVPVMCLATVAGVSYDVSQYFDGASGHGNIMFTDACITTPTQAIIAGGSPWSLELPLTFDWYLLTSAVASGHTLTTAEVTACPTYNKFLITTPCATAGIDMIPFVAPTPANTQSIGRANGPWLFFDFGVVGGGGTVSGLCLHRDYTHQLMIFGTTATGTLIVNLYNDADSSPTTVNIDANTTCSFPSFYQDGTYLRGTYLRGTQPYIAVSKTHGRTWTLTAISGTYTTLASAEHYGRIIALGYRSSVWYCRVGVPDDTGAFSWSSEVALATTSPNGQGHLRTRKDGVLEFVYANTSNGWTVLRGRAVGNNGGTAANWT